MGECTGQLNIREVFKERMKIILQNDRKLSRDS